MTRRPEIDVAAVVGRFVRLESLRRARRRIVLGLVLAPLSCWFAVTRFHPDDAWSGGEVALVAPMLLVAAGLVAAGLGGMARVRARR